ncbi:MAG: DUF4255 domain-containing protein [Scytolyngbya sp. HA4215-MV1]|jgi:hypothetical protein|nr:DUF4255 domain-containing protein [Scytolyngbya sp. HA4215-MV1]
MSQYPVIHAVDETLRSLIADHLDTTAKQILTDPTLQISFKPPHRLMTDTTPTKTHLSLFLYRVVENGEVKNRALASKNGHRLQYPPLALNLFYLITPLITDTEGDEESAKNAHQLLGKVMQIFYDYAIVKGVDLKGLLQNTAEEIRIVLNPISMEDMTKLWSSFMRPYYLSVSYEVKVVYIDSNRETGAEQVRRKQLQFTQMTGG